MFHPLLDKNLNADVIEKKRLDLYMIEMLPHFIGGVFTTAPFFYFIFRQQLTTDVTSIWFSLDAFFAVIVGLVYYLFYKQNESFSFSAWKVLSYIPLVTYCFYVSAAPWLLLQSNSSIYLYTMIVMLIGLTGTTAYAVAYYLPKHFIFLTLPLVSIAIKITTMEIDNTGVIYGVLLFLWVSSFSFAHHIHKSLIGSIEQEYETVQARIDAERANSEKSQFIAAASHDIRQPLQAINLFVSTLKDKNINPEDEIIFDRLEASVDGMSELLNSLLDISKLDAEVVTPQPQHLTLDAIFTKIQYEFETSASLKNIDLLTDANNSVVFADSLLIERVLSNLLANAIRYTDAGRIDLTAIIDSENVNIKVSDTGIGIPADEQVAIFTEFYQLNNPERDRNKGLGLGLSIVKRLCLLQNWSLQLSSETGQGSCFTISVPLGKKDLITHVASPKIALNLQGIDVLIIDDEKDICFSLTQALENWGCKVCAVESAEDACEKLESSPLWRPNLIISDYRLRNNKTGIEAIDQVRGLLSEDVVAMVISGDTAPDRIQEITSRGLTLLHKPIQPAKLRSIMHHKMKHVINPG